MVFGQVLEGMDVVKKIVACGSEVSDVFFLRHPVHSVWNFCYTAWLGDQGERMRNC